MIRVAIRPSLPIAKRHGAEYAMRWLEGVRQGQRDTFDPGDRPRQIPGELRRSCPCGLRIMLRIGRPAMRPGDRGPQPKDFHHYTPSLGDRSYSGTRAQNHGGGVSQVTQHLVRRQRSPTARTVRAEHLEPLFERPQDCRICDCPHGPSGSANSPARAVRVRKTS